MSHVVKVSLEVKSLDALKEACKAMGLEFRENQKTYRWFGRFMGDYPLMEGFKAEDLGHCEHAIGIPGSNIAYEVGVVRRRDGRPGYELTWDFWEGGYGLRDKIGAQGEKLKQQYATAVSRRTLVQQGYRVQKQVTADGRIVLSATK